MFPVAYIPSRPECSFHRPTLSRDHARYLPAEVGGEGALCVDVPSHKFVTLQFSVAFA